MRDRGEKEGRNKGRKDFVHITHSHCMPIDPWKIRSQFPSRSSFTSLTQSD